MISDSNYPAVYYPIQSKDSQYRVSNYALVPSKWFHYQSRVFTLKTTEFDLNTIEIGTETGDGSKI